MFCFQKFDSLFERVRAYWSLELSICWWSINHLCLFVDRFRSMESLLWYFSPLLIRWGQSHYKILLLWSSSRSHEIFYIALKSSILSNLRIISKMTSELDICSLNPRHVWSLQTPRTACDIKVSSWPITNVLESGSWFETYRSALWRNFSWKHCALCSISICFLAQPSIMF